ncbi:DNA glycosylase AlkZ-like family protein [Variovorax paradoxus]|uniref:DNA glycosylase AlkZ-like family protein n=1 Tax=Variovorax paradoxus TaxID=34073 RepID=UPI0027D87874|nr:crosslink repair DNA glycosylase YcaQ family protein [Variovorax paradoxus]
MRAHGRASRAGRPWPSACGRSCASSPASRARSCSTCRARRAPGPDTPAPPRLVAEWDNLLLSHVDRSRVMSEVHRARVFTANGIVRGTVLLDGFVAGIWKIERAKNNAATVVLEPFTRWSKADRLGVEEEGMRLLAFAADGEEERHDVRVL